MCVKHTHTQYSVYKNILKMSSILRLSWGFWKTLFLMFKFATRDCHATFILTWNSIRKKMQTKMVRKWSISCYQQFLMPFMRSTLFKETVIGLLNLILQRKVCLRNRLIQSYRELCYKKPYFSDSIVAFVVYLLPIFYF